MTKSIPVYDPRGIVEAEPKATAARVNKLQGLRLALLDNTKWNANKLLRGLRDRLVAQHGFAVNYYRKESFSLAATPALIAEIVANNDIVVTAIGD